MALHVFDMQIVGLFERSAGHVRKLLNIFFLNDISSNIEASF